MDNVSDTMRANDFSTSEEVGGTCQPLPLEIEKGPYAQWLGCQQDAGDETDWAMQVMQEVARNDYCLQTRENQNRADLMGGEDFPISPASQLCV